MRQGLEQAPARKSPETMRTEKPEPTRPRLEVVKSAAKPEKSERRTAEAIEIEAIREKIRSEKSDLRAKYGDILDGIPENIQKRLSPEDVNAVLEEIDAEFSANPDLREQYYRILLNGDREALRTKTEAQRKLLRKLFFGDSAPSFHPKFLLKPAAWGEYSFKYDKLAGFRDFVVKMRPVRSGEARDEYLSPRETGNIASYGRQDLIAQSDNYVYGSFDEIPHFMADNRDQIELDEGDIADRAEIVMQDIANIAARAGKDKKTVESYITNLFDYETGKELLAYYLAYVFETPEDAAAFLKANNMPQMAQRWDEMPLHLPSRKDLKPGSPEEYRQTENERREREESIREKIQELYELTGIEPPLSLEVRIQGSARKQTT